MSRSSAIITIGNEILLGRTLNTNLAWLASELALAGVPVTYAIVVQDQREQILQALQDTWGKYDIVITTGGLGPTPDDITKASIAEYFGKELQFDPDVWDNVQMLFSRRNMPAPESNRSQALVPAGFTALHNELGTAPGLCHQEGKRVFFALQGVPTEMRHIYTRHIQPMLPALYPEARRITQKTLHSFGISESALAELFYVSDISPQVNLAWLPQTGRVDLRFYGEDEPAVKQAVRSACEKIGHLIWGEDDDTPADALYRCLKDKGLSLAVAESCTGGLIQAYLTEVAGISDVFRGGVVAYHNDVKTGLLDVTSEVVIREGAVCGEVARQMAIGVRQALNSDVSIAITGIAGPAGGSPEKPVGLVWFAYCVYDKVFVEKAVFNGDRAGIRHKAAEMAILKLTRLLKEGTL